MGFNAEWPIYKKELLQIGNLDSSTGLCTLWTQKEKLLKNISYNNFLIAGQCYSPNEGINFIIRNSLANKKMRNIILCGVDLSNTADTLIALMKKGIDASRKIIGTDAEIEPEIPFDAINRFRENVKIIDKRDIHDFLSLDDYLKTLPRLEPWGAPEIYNRSSPEPPISFPSEETGFIIRGKKIGDVWLKILDTILRFGYRKESEYHEHQHEIINLTSIITDEDPKNIDWKPYFNFTKNNFEDYLPQLMTASSIEGISYTYGQKLRDFQGINQIDSIITKLKQSIFSRRAVAVTWDVEKDHDNPNSPCLDLVQALAQDKLHMTAYFRSNDMFKAWPRNAFALRALHYEVSEQVGVNPGSLIIISNSAHIYSSDLEKSKNILKEYPIKLKREFDPRGNIIIDLENNKIKITHLSPDGRRIGEFYADTAKDAYIKIEETQIVSQISHALDIGSELGKAEYALKNGLRYIQDKPL